MRDQDSRNFSLQHQYKIKETRGGNKENIHQGIINWSYTKFSKPTSYESYDRE